MSEVELDVPALSVQGDDVLGWVLATIRQGGEQVQVYGAETLFPDVCRSSARRPEGLANQARSGQSGNDARLHLGQRQSVAIAALSVWSGLP